MKVRVIICGSREYSDYESIKNFLEKNKDKISVVIQGGARGADRCAYDAAIELGIETITFEADWKTHGKSAGPIRNQKMLNEGLPDYVFAYPIGKSIGTRDMMRKAEKAGIKVINMMEKGK